MKIKKAELLNSDRKSYIYENFRVTLHGNLKKKKKKKKKNENKKPELRNLDIL